MAFRNVDPRLLLATFSSTSSQSTWLRIDSEARFNSRAEILVTLAACWLLRIENLGIGSVRKGLFDGDCKA